MEEAIESAMTLCFGVADALFFLGGVALGGAFGVILGGRITERILKMCLQEEPEIDPAQPTLFDVVKDQVAKDDAEEAKSDDGRT